MKIWYARSGHDNGDYMFSLSELVLRVGTGYKVKLFKPVIDDAEVELCCEEAHKLLYKNDWLEHGEGPKEIEVLFGEFTRLYPKEAYATDFRSGRMSSSKISMLLADRTRLREENVLLENKLHAYEKDDMDDKKYNPERILQGRVKDLEILLSSEGLKFQQQIDHIKETYIELVIERKLAKIKLGD